MQDLASKAAQLPGRLAWYAMIPPLLACLIDVPLRASRLSAFRAVDAGFYALSIVFAYLACLGLLWTVQALAPARPRLALSLTVGIGALLALLTIGSYAFTDYFGV